MNENIYYIDLITRYLTSELDKSELAKLHSWLSESAKNQETFDDLKKVFELVGKNTDASVFAINVDDEWSTFQKKIGKQNEGGKVISLKSERKRNFSSKLLRIAAIILLPLIIGSVLFFMFRSPELELLVATTNIVQNKLADGSVVTLNVNSNIEYAKSFDGKQRNVKLNGEAYFKVAHDKAKPFIIETSDLQIKVVGTSFNVNAKEKSNFIEVVVDTGVVQVTSFSNSKQTEELKAGEKAIYLKSEKAFQKQMNKDSNYISWKTKRLNFDHATLKEIVAKLKDVYQTDIVIKQQALENCTLTSPFVNQTLDEIFNVIKDILGVEITKNGNTYEISGKGC